MFSLEHGRIISRFGNNNNDFRSKVWMTVKLTYALLQEVVRKYEIPKSSAPSPHVLYRIRWPVQVSQPLTLYLNLRRCDKKKRNSTDVEVTYMPTIYNLELE
jgi:hypothetical protein